MGFDQRVAYEGQFKAQYEHICRRIKCTLLDGREFTCYGLLAGTWIDIRDGQRKYESYHSYITLFGKIVIETGIPEGDLIVLDADTGERINPPGYDKYADIPCDLTNVLVVFK
jgi:hypothetical protein